MMRVGICSGPRQCHATTTVAGTGAPGYTGCADSPRWRAARRRDQCIDRGPIALRLDPGQLVGEPTVGPARQVRGERCVEEAEEQLAIVSRDSDTARVHHVDDDRRW